MVKVLKFAWCLGIKLFRHGCTQFVDTLIPHNCQPPSTYYRGVISSGKMEYMSSLQQKCVHIINGA